MLECFKVLAQFGKSFNWARPFLDRKSSLDAARLYQFCRHIDDLADQKPPDYEDQLTAIKNSLSHQETVSMSPLVRDFKRLSQEYHWSPEVTKTLVEGVIQDTKKVVIESQEALLRYAYHVAGTVGIMMCPILGAKSKKAYKHAIDLGIAMQITNICRDVLEDADQDRRYLPIPHVSAGNIRAVKKHPISCIDLKVRQNIRRLLALADQYYQSGFNGLGYLPPKSRRTMLLAGLLYQKIGHRLLSKQCAWQQGRVMISSLEKLKMTIIDLPIQYFRLKVRPHDADLHRPLAHLPYV